MKFNEVIKEIGRGKEGATDLPEETAHALYGAMLRGEVPELELGAILIAFRIKGESLEELLGFSRAMQADFELLQPPCGRAMPVVLPSYNGARRQANLTPLLALLLAREGVPVLVHGVTEDPGRVTSAQVFQALGIPPCASMQAAQQSLNDRNLAFVPTAVLSPGLDRLLKMRWRLGVRNSTHTLAKLANPFDGDVLRLVSVMHPEYLHRMTDFFQSVHARAMLLRGCEGEAYANPKRRPRITYFFEGREEVLYERDEGINAAVPDLPQAMDADTTARWIEAVMAGEVSVPQPMAEQIACCVRICCSNHSENIRLESAT